MIKLTLIPLLSCSANQQIFFIQHVETVILIFRVIFLMCHRKRIYCLFLFDNFPLHFAIPLVTHFFFCFSPFSVSGIERFIVVLITLTTMIAINYYKFFILHWWCWIGKSSKVVSCYLFDCLNIRFKVTYYKDYLF